MTQASGLLERDAEVAMLVGLVDSLAGPGAGGAVLIEGPAGIGKSSLLRALVRAARERGDLVALAARGSDLELELAFGGVRQLFAPIVSLPASERDELLSGPAALAASVLGLRDAPAGEFADPLYALAWLVANLAERSPVLVTSVALHDHGGAAGTPPPRARRPESSGRRPRLDRTNVRSSAGRVLPIRNPRRRRTAASCTPSMTPRCSVLPPLRTGPATRRACSS